MDYLDFYKNSRLVDLFETTKNKVSKISEYVSKVPHYAFKVANWSEYVGRTSQDFNTAAVAGTLCSAVYEFVPLWFVMLQNFPQGIPGPFILAATALPIVRGVHSAYSFRKVHENLEKRQH